MATAVPFITVGKKLKLTLVSADNLRDVREWGRMKVYAEVSINEEPETVKKIEADRRGKTNPRWMMAVEYMINEEVLRVPGVHVVVRLMCKRRMGDKFVGKVRIPITKLFSMAVESENVVMGFAVEGILSGTLNVSCSLSARTITTIAGDNMSCAAVSKTARLVASLEKTKILGEFGLFVVKLFS